MRKDVNMEKAVDAYRSSDGLFKAYRAEREIRRHKTEIKRLYVFASIVIVTELACIAYALFFSN